MLRFGSSGSEAPFLTEKDLHEKEKMLEQQVSQFTLASFPDLQPSVLLMKGEKYGGGVGGLIT